MLYIDSNQLHLATGSIVTVPFYYLYESWKELLLKRLHGPCEENLIA